MTAPRWTIPTSIRLSPEALRLLDRLAEAGGCSRSELVRRWILAAAAELAEEQPTLFDVKETPPRKFGSMAPMFSEFKMEVLPITLRAPKTRQHIWAEPVRGELVVLAAPFLKLSLIQLRPLR